MAKETIDAIRSAEEEGRRLERSAREEAEAILTEAGKKAQELKDTMIREAAAKTAQAKKEAEAEAERMIRGGEDAQSRELAALREQAAGKTDEAVKAVLSRLLWEGGV